MKKAPPETIKKLIDYYQNRKFEELILEANKYIKEFPNDYFLYNILGATFIIKKNFKEALLNLNLAIKISPSSLEAYNNIGNIYRLQKKYDEALVFFKKTIELNPNFFEGYNNLGNVLYDQKKYNEAKIKYEKAISANPQYAEAYFNLGLCFVELGEIDSAIKFSKKAIQIKGNYSDAINNLGNLYLISNQYDLAIDCYYKAININPKKTLFHNNLLELLEKLNKEKELEEAQAKTKKELGDHPLVQLFQGVIFYRKKEYKESKICFEKAIELNENKKNENLEISILSRLIKVCDKMNEIKLAYNYSLKLNFLSKNSLKNKDFNKEEYINSVEKRYTHFMKTNLQFVKNENGFLDKKAPVFIIGFPRSGTTLLDTILRTHTKIEIIEEKSCVVNMIKFISKNHGSELNALKGLSTKEIQKIQNFYLKDISSNVKVNNKIIIDKYPLNIIHVGEIFHIFPNAKFILAIRNPADCILSCFMQNFKINHAMASFYNIEDAAYLYDKIMRLWQVYTNNLKINYITIKYEDLVTNLKKTIFPVLKFVDLEWENDLINFVNTAKKRERINTPSYDQVIQPLYQQSNNKWLNYKDHMSNVLPTIKPWLKYFEYE